MLHVVSSILLLGDLRFGESSKKGVLAFYNNDVLEKGKSMVSSLYMPRFVYYIYSSLYFVLNTNLDRRQELYISYNMGANCETLQFYKSIEGKVSFEDTSYKARKSTKFTVCAIQEKSVSNMLTPSRS